MKIRSEIVLLESSILNKPLICKPKVILVQNQHLLSKDQRITLLTTLNGELLINHFTMSLIKAVFCNTISKINPWLEPQIFTGTKYSPWLCHMIKLCFSPAVVTASVNWFIQNPLIQSENSTINSLAEMPQSVHCLTQLITKSSMFFCAEVKMQKMSQLHTVEKVVLKWNFSI